MNKQLHKRLCNYLARENVSQSSVARRLGISPTSLSQYKSETYAGSVKHLEKKIQGFLDREFSRGNVLDIPMLELTSSKEIRKSLSMAHAVHGIAVVVGEAGCGKTSALREYAHSTDASVLIEIDPTFTTHTLIMSVARELGVSTSGTANVVSGMIVEKLSQSDMLIIFDEADYLTGSALDWIRRVIHDKSECAVALCGLPRLEHVLRTARGDHDQLLSRVDVFVSIRGAKTDDMKKLLEAVWQTHDELLVREIVKKSHGSIRRAVKLLQLASRISKNNGESTPSVESVQDASNFMMRERMGANQLHEEVA